MRGKKKLLPEILLDLYKITDYFNARKSVVLNKLMTGTLWLSTTGVLVGCYQFNTNDIGLTEFVARIWA
jgi:hypothetical protein